MTDSGGMQKEAFFMKKNCVTMRQQTEWVELADNGYTIVTGANTDKILDAYREMMNRKSSFSENFYGDGHAAEKILKSLQDF